MICFAILAHENEGVLEAQIANFRHYNPDSRIVIYNGGKDSEFAKNLNAEICPYSCPLTYGNLTPFLWDVMKWLEESNAEYDYLVNFDHDVLFIKHGFDRFLDEAMKGYDCMGPHLQIQNTPHDYPDFGPGLSMWREWHRWQPFFQTDYFARYFNPGQVYRPDLIRRMLTGIDSNRLEQLLSSSNVFALEEMFFPTLAMIHGANIRNYPWNFEESLEFVRHLGNVTEEQIEKARQLPYYFWIHPIKGESLKQISRWLQT